jgi:hypothetical protein
MSKKKLILLLSIFLFIGMGYTISNVRGHSPSSMTLNYNLVSEELTVSITHNVANPNDHYVDRVRIWVNASLVNTSLYTSQPTSSSFAYIYNIAAKNGSTIQVTTDCSISGSITRSINVGFTNGQTEEPAIPGFLGTIPTISISIFIIILLIKRKFNAKKTNSK